MSAITFDTHENVKKLTAVGFTDEQAEVQTNIIASLVQEQLATKQDLNEMESALKRDMNEMESALKRDMKEMESALRRDMKELEVALKRDIEELKLTTKRDLKELELSLTHKLTIRLGSMMVVGIVVVATLVKIL